MTIVEYDDKYLENYDYFKEQKTKKLVPSENISHGRRK